MKKMEMSLEMEISQQHCKGGEKALWQRNQTGSKKIKGSREKFQTCLVHCNPSPFDLARQIVTVKITFIYQH